MEWFLAAANLKAVHVPYKGSPAAAMAIVAGDVQLLLTVAPALLPLVQDGKIKLLAVTGAQSINRQNYDMKALRKIDAARHCHQAEVSGPGLVGALLALWNDVDPALDAEYNDWHGREHVPERLNVPGILWARRYLRASPVPTMPRYLTMYGLRDADVLESEAYDRLLREPTPWSFRMRPALVNISRWVCTIHSEAEMDASQRITVLALSDEQAGGPVGLKTWLATIRTDGQVVGRRQPQHRPLPWMKPGQGQGIDGQWLVCLANDDNCGVEGPAAVAGTSYSRLTVG
ncbi:MAG: tripartite tricarboxylate transporter substrate-binding protein [Ideonella sp.]